MIRKSMMLIVVILLFCSCAGGKDVIEDSSDFNFILSYGTYGKNEMDTFSGIYTKDLVEGTAKTSLNLTDEEMKIILDELLRIDFFHYPTKFKSYRESTPYSKYIMYVEYGGEKKKVEWTSDNIPYEIPDMIREGAKPTFIENDDTRQIIDLVRLEQMIEEFIASKEEYKELPTPASFYE